jgi:GNAT superfamily N-acetyltransferase
VTLRNATTGDRHALVDLVLRCDRTYADWAGPELRIPARDEELAHWHRRFADPLQRIRVAEVDGSIAGTCAWTQARTGHGLGPPIHGRAHVSAMFVDPAHWRQGIAATLMRDAVSAMVEAGFTSAQLWTPEGAPARRFYEACGWTVTGATLHMPELNLPLVMYETSTAPEPPRPGRA